MKNEMNRTGSVVARRAPIAVALACALSVACVPVVSASTLQERGSDLWKEAKIATTYSLNERLSVMDIDVEVEDGVAVLTGSVESEVDRQLAEDFALGVEGINKVSNRLAVRPGIEPTAENGEWRRAVNDAAITARIKSRLLWNSRTDGLDVNVSTRDGRVSIEGTVNSVEEARLIEQIALNTEGVRGVMSRLVVGSSKLDTGTATISKAATKVEKTVDSAASKTGAAVESAGQAVTDAWITAKVETLVLIDRRFVNSDVDVSTRDRVVTLTGSVETRKQLEDLVQMVSHVKGVQNVHSAVNIGSS